MYYLQIKLNCETLTLIKKQTTYFFLFLFFFFRSHTTNGGKFIFKRMDNTIKKNLSPDLRRRIYESRKDGYSVNMIARMFRVSERAVRETVKRFEETHSFNDRPKSGRPRIISERATNLMIRSTCKNPEISPSELKAISGTSASVATIRRHLARCNFKKIKARKKRALSLETKEARLKFAQKWVNNSDISKIRFSDETSVTKKNNNTSDSGSAEVDDDDVSHHQDRGKVDDDGNHFDLSQARPLLSFTVWGCVWDGGRSPLIIMNPTGETETIGSQDYIETLEKGLLPTASIPGMLLQHDNAPIHTSSATKSWLKQHDIVPIEWPPYSSDLNPIEDVWQLLKSKIEEDDHNLRNQSNNLENRDELKKIINQCWESIDQEEINNIVGSFEKRLQEVIENDGGHTKY